MEEFHLTPIHIDELSQSLHPFQSAPWAYIKQKNGWKGHAFKLTIHSSEQSINILILTKKLPPIFAFAYIPFAGLLNISETPNVKFIQQLAKKSQRKITPSLFLRYDFPFTFSDEENIIHIKGRPHQRM